VGRAKQHALEQADAGFSSPSRAVCADHLVDDALRRVVASMAGEGACDFCGREGDGVAADTDDVLQHIAASIRREYGRAEEELMHDGETGGYAGQTWTIDEVLANEEPVADDDFRAFVCDAFRDALFCERDPWKFTVGEALSFSWEQLVDTVKHKTRFLFALTGERDGEMFGGDRVTFGVKVLEQLGALINEFNLVADLAADDELVRVRLHPADDIPNVGTAKELGAPPDRFASQSRMSPAGVPMLYAADDLETALAETLGPAGVAGQVATAGIFRPRRGCRIVDLTRLAPVPSLFEPDPAVRRQRAALTFLHSFRAAVSAPIERDDRIHIDYVPTQVVSEYLRRVLVDRDGRHLDGLAWGSSQRPDGRNVVLWLDNEHCLGPGEILPPWHPGELAVELVRVERFRLSIVAEPL